LSEVAVSSVVRVRKELPELCPGMEILAALVLTSLSINVDTCVLRKAPPHRLLPLVEKVPPTASRYTISVDVKV
jgi:hypothetical protein